MSFTQRDVGQIRRLFRGDFGSADTLYDNVILQGDVEPLATLESVLGLYASDPRVRCFDVYRKTDITMTWFARHIQHYDVDDPTEEQMTVLDVEYPGWRDPAVQEVLWREIREKFDDLGLPSIFASCMQAIDGTPSIVLWYPRYLPASGMLSGFQDRVKREL